jgi:hypothetical protein
MLAARADVHGELGLPTLMPTNTSRPSFAMTLFPTYCVIAHSSWPIEPV